MQQQEKELFGDYEIKNWNISPRIYKIIAASAALNLLVVFVMAQGSLLTRKGCDSPLVSSVCQVLDTVMLGSSLLGTDSEFVSKDYEKNQLEDAEITYIDVSNDAPPLKYPEGYFALANPEKAAMMPDPMMMSPTTIENFGSQPSFGGFSAPLPNGSPSPDLLGSKATPPPVNNNPIIGDLPSSIHGSPNPIAAYKKPRPYKFPKAVTPKPSKLPNESPTDLPNLGGNTETAKNKADKPKPAKTPEAQKPIESEKVAGVQINKKPFEDLGDTLNDKVAKKEVDLNKPFFVVLEGALTADGKFDKKSKFTKYEGDKGMVDVAKLALESVGDSGILKFLKDNGVDKVNFTLVQDDKQIYAIIVSEQKTPEKAQTTVSLVNTGLQTITFADNTGLTKLDENSKTLLSNSKVSSEGKSFIFKFNIPKPVGRDLIDKSLKQRAEKKNSSQPNNSNQVGQNANANTSK